MSLEQTDLTEPAKVLSIGGWDPCGAFGLAADLKTFAALGAHGMGAITVTTAQNSLQWLGAQPVTPALLTQQLDAILSDYGAKAVKTGFIGNAEFISIIAQKIRDYKISKVVIDPVLLNARGESMFSKDVKEAYEDLLFPLASVITPNLKELHYLLHRKTSPWTVSAEQWERVKAYHRAFLSQEAFIMFKGLELNDAQPSRVDAWSNGQDWATEPAPWIKSSNLSGSGDTLSAAITVALARGFEPVKAMRFASRFTHAAIQSAQHWQLAAGPGPTDNFLQTKQLEDI